jgi:dolichol-phosphate mannosyltransferase
LKEMGRRYLSTVLKIYAEKLLISDDLLAERLSRRAAREDRIIRLEQRMRKVVSRLRQYEDRSADSGSTRRVA